MAVARPGRLASFSCREAEGERLRPSLASKKSPSKLREIGSPVLKHVLWYTYTQQEDAIQVEDPEPAIIQLAC